MLRNAIPDDQNVKHTLHIIIDTVSIDTIITL